MLPSAGFSTPVSEGVGPTCKISRCARYQKPFLLPSLSLAGGGEEGNIPEHFKNLSHLTPEQLLPT